MNSTAAQDTYALQQDLAHQERLLDDLKFQPNPGLDHPRVVAEAERAIQPLRDRVAQRQSEVGGKVFRIPEQNVELLIEKLGKLNKRATKLDVPGVTHTLHETIEVERIRNKRKVFELYQFVAVDGISPRLAGWRFVATLEHDENGVILRKLPTFEGEVDLTAYREATPENCDHCQKVRRRNDTYVVQHEDGTLKQVGSNCLVDFLGGVSPQRIAQWMEYVADLIGDLDDEESVYYGGSAPERLPLIEYMTHVACMIRENGWKSRGSAYNYGGTATADDASNNMHNQAIKAKDRQGVPLWIDPIDDDRVEAEKAIAWVRALEESDLKSDYLYNLFTVLKGESLGRRQLGIAASAISASQKAEQKRIEREATKASEFVGAVGEKLTTAVTVSRIIWIEDRFNPYGGSKPLYKMVDADGNQISWFSSKDKELNQGDKITITGTVKAHDDGKGRYGDSNYGKSTVLTRCKIA